MIAELQLALRKVPTYSLASRACALRSTPIA